MFNLSIWLPWPSANFHNIFCKTLSIKKMVAFEAQLSYTATMLLSLGLNFNFSKYGHKSAAIEVALLGLTLDLSVYGQDQHVSISG